MNVDLVAGVESGRRSRGGFWHEAQFYAGSEDFIRKTSTFVREGLDLGEPVLVLVVPAKIELLRDELGSESARVRFGDMAEIGRNPGRIISRWRDFVSEHAASGGRVRGIGEPIWPGRSIEELVEAQRHESLVNLALAGAPAWVLCPYDLDALDPTVIDDAFRSHPIVSDGSFGSSSTTYQRLETIERPFDAPLNEVPATAEVLDLSVETLSVLRSRVGARAAEGGIDASRARDFVLAVNEVASNSLLHGAGRVTVTMWTENGHFVSEVRDQGVIREPLAGRRRPAIGDRSGYGLWIANELCDLVQLRSFRDGSAVRLRVRRS